MFGHSLSRFVAFCFSGGSVQTDTPVSHAPRGSRSVRLRTGMSESKGKSEPKEMQDHGSVKILLLGIVQLFMEFPYYPGSAALAGIWTHSPKKCGIRLFWPRVRSSRFVLMLGFSS